MIAPGHRSARILVAEDDDEMRSLVCDALRHEGYDVRAVSDGGHLLGQIVSGGEVDLIISDVRMPLFSGTAILRGVRSGRWMVPVILMTAFSDEATRALAKQFGATLVDKPFPMDDLRATVARLLRLA